MSLTKAVLLANSELASLSDEQVAAIEELSKNDENTVIGTKIGELHGQYDADVLSITGIAKNQGEKSYDYVKRVLGSYKDKAAGADALNDTITGLKTEIEGYKKTIAEGKGNEAIAQQLKDAQKQLADTQALYETDKKKWEDKYTDLNSQYQGKLIDSEFGLALKDIKFKSVYPESVQRTLIDSAKRTILATATPDWQEDGNGNKKLVFRDKDGNIMTNKENKMNPYTPGELLRQQLKDVIDTGRQQRGTGTGGSGTGGSGTGDIVIDLTGARTQVEADEMIKKHLMSLGMLRGSKEFTEQAMKLRKENEVEKLPMN